jgi:hypothetical protein
MKRLFVTSLTAFVLILSGCASTTVRSDVTVFHEWPAEIPDKNFVFERSREQDNNLEYRNYENQVKAALLRMGLVEATASRSPKLKVAISYGIKARDVRIVEATHVDSFWYNSPLYGHRWRGRGYYGPFYDPFFPATSSTEYIESSYEIFSRQLKVIISQIPSGKKIYDATVTSEGSNGSLAAVMPYLVRSVFSDFPGISGVPRHIELKIQD